MSERKRRKAKRRVTIIVIIIIIAVSSLLYYFSIAPLPPNSPYVQEFATKQTAIPNAIAVDDQGRVWFASWNETALGMLYPSNGTIRMFTLPEPSNSSLETWGITVDSVNGVVWFTDHISNAIWSFNIKSHAFTKYPIPTGGSFPYQIALDQNGNVWFSEMFVGKLGELTTQGLIKEYIIPGSGYTPDPTGLVMENETLWFTEPNENMIGAFYNGAFTLYNVTGTIFSPVGIAFDSHGNLWVTQHTYPGLVSEFNPSNRYVKTFATSFPSELGTSLPYFIYTDARGNVWFNEHYGNSIAFLNPASSELIEYHVPLRVSIPGNLSGILTMALSQNGEPWFTEFFTGNIGTINTSAPIEQRLSVTNSAQTINIANGTNSKVSLTIQGKDVGYLSAYVGNFTQSINFVFSPSSGSGNFSSTLTVQNNGAKPGVYFVTISDATEYLTVSQVVQVDVP